MGHSIDLPQRADNHIRETSGYKVLENKIPAEWIIREITERDYGIDCYIEFVDENNCLTGEVAFIQMKTTDNIDWRIKDKGFKFNKVEKSTTNYLRGFKIPTFLFLVDLSTKEMFFVPVKEYILEHYQEYMEYRTFAYDLSHDNNLFTKDSFLRSFRISNLYDQFRNELHYFMSNMHNYIGFMREHNNRDCFMQIGVEEMMFFESMLRNITFLQNYFCTNNNVPTIAELSRGGVEKYGDDYEQTLFEGVLTDLFKLFKTSLLELIDYIVDLVTVKESFYWAREKNYIFNYFLNINKSTLFQ